MEELPNYQNKYTKTTTITQRRKNIISALLAVSIGLNVASVLIPAVKDIKNDIIYNMDSNEYFDLVQKNLYVINGDMDKNFIDIHKVAKTISLTQINTKEDFYHILIKTALQINFNRNENFNDLLEALRLDNLAFSNPVYPSYNDLNEFLQENGLYNDDGTINFDEWEKYDKKVFAFNQELESDAKERKGL